MIPIIVGGDVPFHLKFALKVTHPLWKAPTSTNIWDRWQRRRRPRMQRRLHNLPLKISFNNRQIQQSLSHACFTCFTRDFKTTGIAFLALDRSAERLYDVEIGIPTRPSHVSDGELLLWRAGWLFDVNKLSGRIASFRCGDTWLHDTGVSKFYRASCDK